MSQSFDLWSFVYGLNPLKLPQYLGTSYNRSHLLQEVFYHRVFDKQTFGQLRYGRPTLLLNATNYSTGERFVFSNYSFNTMRSDLGALPISVGVTASAAFPGVFSVVTFKDFSSKKDPIGLDVFAPSVKQANSDGDYFHLFDGGVSDNLGVDTLIDTVSRSGPFSRGCLLILVDASVPYEQISSSKNINPRHFWDALIDTNALSATSILMQSKRRQQLKAIGFDDANHLKNLKWTYPELKQLEDVWMKTDAPEDLEALKSAIEKRKAAHGVIAKPISPTSELGVPISFLEDAILTRVVILESPEVKAINCNVWHIALDDLVQNSLLQSLYTKDYSARNEKNLNIPFKVFQGQVGGIGTRFNISDSEVRALYMAADLLVNETNSRNTICRWLDYITGQKCTVP
jgi:predicted acylesterase/phospholipase RssA